MNLNWSMALSFDMEFIAQKGEQWIDLVCHKGTLWLWISTQKETIKP